MVKGGFDGAKEKTGKGEPSGDEINCGYFLKIQKKERVEREECFHGIFDRGKRCWFTNLPRCWSYGNAHEKRKEERESG